MQDALEDGRPLRALELHGRGSEAAARISVSLREAAADGDQSRRSRRFSAGDAAKRIERRAAAQPASRRFSRARRPAPSAVCAKIELEIAQLEPADAAAFLADLGLSESGLDRVIRASYDLLGYISFFTVGEDECRAWSIPRGTPAQLAAGEIHSDIARGFIRAEVVGYDALDGRGSMAACRDHGEVRLEGKEYVVQDGDIINFRFAT